MQTLIRAFLSRAILRSDRVKECMRRFVYWRKKKKKSGTVTMWMFTLWYVGLTSRDLACYVTVCKHRAATGSDDYRVYGSATLCSAHSPGKRTSEIFGATNPTRILSTLRGVRSWHSNDAHGESYSSEVSQTSIEAFSTSGSVRGDRFFACFHVVLGSFTTPLSRASLVLAIVPTNYAY